MEGLGDKEIAQTMGISIGTVRTYWKRIATKVGGNTRAEIVTTFARQDSARELDHERSLVARLEAEVAQRREAEARFRAICACSPVGIVVSDSVGECLYVNPAWERITGLRLVDIQGEGWRHVIHPDDLPKFIEWATAGMESGTPEPLEYRFVVDGKDVWIRSNFSPMIVDDRTVGTVSSVEIVDDCVRQRMAENVRPRSVDRSMPEPMPA